MPTRKEMETSTAAEARKEVSTPTAEELKGVCRANNVQPTSVSRVQKSNNGDNKYSKEEINNQVNHKDSMTNLGCEKGDGTNIGEATEKDMDEEIEEIFRQMRDNPMMAKTIINGMSKEENAFFSSLEAEINQAKREEDPPPQLFATNDIPECPSTPNHHQDPYLVRSNAHSHQQE